MQNKLKLGIVTGFGVNDGIAVHSLNLISEIKKYANLDLYILCSRNFANIKLNVISEYANNIHFCWDRGSDDLSELIHVLRINQIDLVHIQWHLEYFNMFALINLINILHSLNIRIYISLHTLAGLNLESKELLLAFTKLEKLYIHSHHELEVFIHKGVSNCELTILPFWNYVEHQYSNELITRIFNLINTPIKKFPIVVTHGLASSNKGILETIEAIKLLLPKYPDIYWLGLHARGGNAHSQEITDSAFDLITKLNLENHATLFTEYINSDNLVIEILSHADIRLLPYVHAGESASAVIRKFMASSIDVLATDIEQFADVAEFLTTIPNNLPETIANSIDMLISAKDSKTNNTNDRYVGITSKKEMMIKFVAANSWQNAANKLITDYQQINAN